MTGCESIPVHPPYQGTSIEPDNTITIITNYGTGDNSQTIINLPSCRVCKGSGLVYGTDGKPYLCPKCDGDGIAKDKMTYPYVSPIVPQYLWPWYGYIGDNLDNPTITFCCLNLK